MKQKRPLVPLVGVAMAAFLFAAATRSEAQTGIERKTLLQQDLTIPGYETRLVEATVAAGAREGRHSHAGTLVIYVLEGEFTFEQDGLPTKILKAGDSVFVAPGQVHEGINKGGVPVKLVATFIVEKGKPITTPAP